MAKFDFLIGDDGEARAVSSLCIFFKDDTVRDIIQKRIDRGEARLLYWVPVTSTRQPSGIFKHTTDECPENCEKVLCTDGVNVWFGIWFDEYGFTASKVTAWMRLPSPYKEEGEA